MAADQSVYQKVQQCRDFYQVITPDEDSVNLAERLWATWETHENPAPDVSGIARSVTDSDLEFFNEMSRLAVAQVTTGSWQGDAIEYCPFCTDDYAFCAITCSDGFVVLVDELYLQIVFVISFVLMHTIYGEASELSAKAGRLAVEMAEQNFVRGLPTRFDISNEAAFEAILSADYDLVSASGYLFQSFKFFVIAHELGHVVLGHGKDDRVGKGGSNGNCTTVPADLLRNQEFDADEFGCRLFLNTNKSLDNTRPTFFEYRFDFAPILFLDICERLDQRKARHKGASNADQSHPPLCVRRQRLVERFGIDLTDDTYLALRDALEELL